MLIRTTDGEWYVCELRGAVFVTWVTAAEREYAASFPDEKIGDWLAHLSARTGKSLEAAGMDGALDCVRECLVGDPMSISCEPHPLQGCRCTLDPVVGRR